MLVSRLIKELENLPPDIEVGMTDAYGNLVPLESVREGKTNTGVPIVELDLEVWKVALEPD